MRRRRFLEFNAFQNTIASGQFGFNRGMTQGPNALVSCSNAGHGLASLLLGMGSGGSIDHISGLALQRNYYALYVQDDWKLTPKLTANLGLRYDLTTGQTERFDRLARMDLQAPSPLSVPGAQPTRPAAIRPARCGCRAHWYAASPRTPSWRTGRRRRSPARLLLEIVPERGFAIAILNQLDRRLASHPGGRARDARVVSRRDTSP
jgi:hypothetical protein